MKKRLLILLLVLVLMSGIAIAETVDIYFFYGQGCPHCAREEIFLDGMQAKYDITLHAFETYHNQENRDQFTRMSAAYGRKVSGVPTTFIDNKMIVGFNEQIGTQIEEEIKRCQSGGCQSPGKRLDVYAVEVESSPAEEPGLTTAKRRLTIPTVLIAAAVDAINPCAFAVLIILMTTVLAAGGKRRAFFAGLAFSISIYISYLLMGLGLFSALQAAGLAHWFYAIVAGFAIVIGLFNLKDYFWYGKFFVMEVPLRWRPKMKMLIKGVTSPAGAFLIGFAVSLFLLPCTSGPYIVILGLLAQTTTFTDGLGYLLLYNLVFILPMLIITFAVASGLTTTHKAEEWRQRKLKVLHLIAGVILLLLGTGMFVAMGLGMV